MPFQSKLAAPPMWSQRPDRYFCKPRQLIFGRYAFSYWASRCPKGTNNAPRRLRTLLQRLSLFTDLIKGALFKVLTYIDISKYSTKVKLKKRSQCRRDHNELDKLAVADITIGKGVHFYRLTRFNLQLATQKRLRIWI